MTLADQVNDSKMTIADHVLTAIEKTLLKTTEVYQYTEILPFF